MGDRRQERSWGVLVVDDERTIRRFLSELLERRGYRVATASDGVEALDELSRAQYHVAIVDLNMPRMGGIELITAMARDFPEVVTIILTAHGTMENAIEALRVGAFDFLTKPLDSPETLRVVVRKALEHRSLQDGSTLAVGETEGMIVEDPASRMLLETIGKVAPTSVSVLLLGESGAGKEIIAHHIHTGSDRHDKPFVAINCAALTETLLESELFGHEKGAFTGATKRKRGKFEIADGGTLFLDEVAEMSPALQAKLLRVLQEQTFERVGGTVPISVDVRIVAATNRDLEQLIRDGVFRDDLFYRLAVMPIRVPPLRDRPLDLAPLTDHFLALFCRKHGKPLTTLSTDARAALGAYSWPGNIRELKNVIERAVILADSPLIGADLLLLPSPTPAPAKGIPVDTLELSRLEEWAIIEALDKTGGNRRLAADLLGISLRSLQYKLKDLGLTEK